MTERLPDFLVIGASKAGTTSISRWLYDHPDLHVTHVKEVRYFDTEENYALGPEWYSRQFQDPDPKQLVGEVTPSYLWHPEAPTRIKALLPDVRLIAMLRNPADRFHSQYWHMRAWTPGDYPEVGEIADRALSGDPEFVDLIERGHYAEQIARYDALFGEDALLVVLFEQVRDHAEEAFLAITRHIGVRDFVPEIVGTALNKTHKRRSPALHAAMTRHRAWDRAPRLALRIDRLNTKYIDYPPLPKPVRRRLLDHYEPHTRALEARLGVQLPEWFV